MKFCCVIEFRTCDITQLAVFRAVVSSHVLSEKIEVNTDFLHHSKPAPINRGVKLSGRRVRMYTCFVLANRLEAKMKCRMFSLY